MSRLAILAVSVAALAAPSAGVAAPYDIGIVRVSVTPKQRTVTEGTKTIFRVTLRNETDARIREIRACAKFVGLGAIVCEAPFGVLRTDEAKTARIFFRPPARRKPYKVVFYAEADDVRSARDRATLRVRAPR